MHLRRCIGISILFRYLGKRGRKVPKLKADYLIQLDILTGQDIVADIDNGILIVYIVN